MTRTEGVLVGLVVVGLALRYVDHPDVPRWAQPLPSLSLTVLGLAFAAELGQPWIPGLIAPVLVSLIVAGAYDRRGDGGPPIPLLARLRRSRHTDGSGPRG